MKVLLGMTCSLEIDAHSSVPSASRIKVDIRENLVEETQDDHLVNAATLLRTLPSIRKPKT